MAEAERRAFAQMWLDLTVQRAVDFVGREHHHHVGRGRPRPRPARSRARPLRPRSCFPSRRAARRPRRPAVVQVQRLGAALVAVADDRDALAGERRRVDVGVAQQLHGGAPSRRPEQSSARYVDVERFAEARPIRPAAGARTRYIGAWRSGGSPAGRRRSPRRASISPRRYAAISRTPIARITGRFGIELARQQRLDLRDRAVLDHMDNRSSQRRVEPVARRSRISGLSSTSLGDRRLRAAAAIRRASGRSTARLRARARCASCRRA